MGGRRLAFLVKEGTTLKAAIYARVSTHEQVENYSIEVQLERARSYCESKGWTVYDEYVDAGYSGATLERPDLQRMLDDLDKIDVVLVYKLDRLSRSQRDTLTLIEDYFLKNNIEFVSITETIDTSTPFGKAMVGILSVFAQLERETIMERLRFGHMKRVQEGYRVPGGNYDPAGYKRENGELVIKDDEAEHIRVAFDLYEQYHSITKVQKRLKEMGFTVWRFRRYRDILSNPLYCGYVSFAGELYKGRHEPIITEEQFERVQELLARHRGHNAHKAKESLLSGLLVCSRCGEMYVSYSTNDQKSNGKKYYYYICKARRFPSEYDKKCMNKNWNRKKLDKLIINEINNLILDKRLEEKEVRKIDYTQQIKKVDEKIERLLTLYVDGNIDKALLDKQIEKLNREKEELVQQKILQDKQLRSTITADQLKQYAIDLDQADFATRQAVVQKLIRCIYIDGENVEIEWNF